MKLRCGIIGVTGMVGLKLLKGISFHPVIELTVVAASKKTAGMSLGVKFLRDNKNGIDKKFLELVIQDASEIEIISKQVDFIFCAVNMPDEEIIKLEEAYARHGVVVVSNNSTMRFFDDVPMIVPEINGIEHLKVLDVQRKRLGTEYGCIAVKPNCAAQAYMAILDAFLRANIEIDEVNLSLMQAISGSGKHLDKVPEIQGNILALPGEAKKSMKEPKKIFGKIVNGKFENAEMQINASSYRVPVEDGHTANITIKTKPHSTTIETLKKALADYNPLAEYNLHSSPNPVINYLGDDVYPNPLEHVNNQDGMEFTCGAMTYDTDTGIIQITGLIHNLVRGAAGGAILTAELMIALGYIKPKV